MVQSKGHGSPGLEEELKTSDAEPIRRTSAKPTLQRLLTSHQVNRRHNFPRAVHLETLNIMEADSFIIRRGKVHELRSDRGTNFVGARHELSDALQELNRDHVKDFLLTKDCD